MPRLLMILLLLLLIANTAYSQEFRVYTKVSDQAARLQSMPQNSNEKAIISRSISLFHVGKVYDYIDSISEVIIFEPNQNRFTLLNTTRNQATRVDFDELQNLIKVARNETVAYVRKLEKKAVPTQQSSIQLLKHQLEPQFEEVFQKEMNRVQLINETIQYTASCTKHETPELIESYLRYADWIARLNFVLHPQALYPAPRLALNASLREKALLPLEVELKIDSAEPLHLKAQHQIHWELDAHDRTLINSWERLHKGKQLEWVSFVQYQRNHYKKVSE